MPTIPNPNWPTSLAAAFLLGIVGVASSAVSQIIVDPLTKEEREKAGSLHKEYKDEATPAARKIEILTEALELPREVQKVFFAFLDKEIEPKWDAYFRGYAAAAATVGKEKRSAGALAEIEQNRRTLAEIRKMGEDAMKPALKDKGKPALDRLLALHKVTPEEVAAASPKVGEARELLLAMVKLHGDYKEELFIAKGASYSEADMKEREAAAAEDALKISGDDRAVLRENERLKAEIQPEEYAGILELNRWRIAMGLNAVRIDTKLCEASRDHSKDMNERGFFAHDSPVPGKENPWKRAKLAGTTAGAENIYSGGSDSHGANMGWFYSPGHHKNMFGGHRRVGLGNDGGKWTQMFGG